MRVLDSPNPVGQLRIDGPLSVLLVQAQPIDLPPLNLQESKKALREVFGRRAEIKVLARASPAKLRFALEKKTFHILHYDGHGFFDEYEESGFLALENDKRKSHRLSGQQLANYLSGTQVRLVVLSACQTAQDSMRQRFVGVAQQLIRSSNLPAVVAMQFAIPDKSAIAFNRGFYGALANGFPVDAALAAGRMAIQEVTKANAPDWATPLLIMRSTDGRLWEHFINEQEVTPILSSRDPYVGLQTFQEEDAEWFFGREGLVKLLQEKVEESPFLAILGPSGSGKSSVVLAGLLPALKAGVLPGSDKWLYLSIKPTDRPLDSLAAALNKLQGGDLGTLSRLRRVLVSDEHALLLAADMIRADNANARLVLVVDQFEELWTLAPTESDARQAFGIEKQTPFIRLLLSAIKEQKQTTEPSLLIILTMRIDFLHRAAETRELARYIGEHDVIVSPMQPYELRKAIEEPAKKAGGTFEPGLVDELIEQTMGRQGALPLLEYTLQELWQAKLPDGTMTWDAFKKLNGVEGALAARADAILDEHYNTPEKREQLRHLLLRLVQPGEGTADTRRRVLLNELVPAGTDLERVQTLLKPLVDERLLTTTGKETIGEETVEVSHEALINAWPTFKQWIDNAREDLRFQLQLEEAAKEWESNKENNDYLWSGLRLANAEIWLKRAQPSLNERDKRFLEASRAEEKARAEVAERARREREQLLEARAAAERRNSQRLRTFLAVGSVLLIVALVLAGLAFNGQQEATNAQSTAQAETTRAVKAESTAQAQAQRSQSLARADESLLELSSNHPERALLLALASFLPDEKRQPPLIARALRNTLDETLIRRSLIGHTDDITAVAWSPDGQQVLTAGDALRDGTARIWNPFTGEQVRSLEKAGEGDSLIAVAWSLDGQQILGISVYGMVHIWDAATGERVHYIQLELNKCRGYSLWHAVWSPDRQQVLTNNSQYGAPWCLWDIKTGNLLSDVAEPSTWGHEENVEREKIISPDEKKVLSVNGLIRVRDATTGELLHVLGEGNGRTEVAWSPNGQQILTGNLDGKARIFNIKPRDNVLVRDATAVAWSPDGKQIITGSEEGTAHVWDIMTRERVHTLVGHTGRITSVDWSPNKPQVVTGSRDGTARIWHTTTGNELQMIEGWIDVEAVAWSLNGQQLLTGVADGAVRVWDAEKWQVVHTLLGHSDRIKLVSWGPDGKKIVTGDDRGVIRIWDLATKQPINLNTSSFSPVVWSPNGQQVLTRNREEQVHLWDVETGTLRHTFATGYAIGWSSDGQQVLTVGNKVRLWDTTTWTVVRTLEHISAATEAYWSPDEQLLLTREDGEDEVVRIWETSDKLVYGKLTERVCNIMSDKEIETEMPEWRNWPGCEAELEALAEDLAKYNLLEGGE